MADVSRRRHDGYVDQFQAEAGDPLYQSVEGALIGDLEMKRGRAGAHADLTVVEFCPEDGARLAGESDLVCS
jgi:hypothetical protein